MPIKTPTLAQVHELAARFNIHLDEDEARAIAGEMAGAINTFYAPLDTVPDYLPEVAYPRTPGYRPDVAEDPHNAWYRKTRIAGASGGALAGKRVVVKDTIALAGVPMMNGALPLEGYTPDIDATVVTRLLDAGAEIVGKSNCEFYCSSGGSHTCATGPVHNPHRRGYSAGGSSSGSAVIIATGAADIAIGGDQGCSIRIPASYCGIYGLKPTWGLVPYTGVFSSEATIDHIGPMTASVADNALALEVIAGYDDGLDPRQSPRARATYTDALGGSVAGMRIAMVGEGFSWDCADAGVNATVRAAAEVLRKLGAQVDEISIPAHSRALEVWLPIIVEGGGQRMLHGNGQGDNWRGLYWTSLIDVQSKWIMNADTLPPGLKTMALLGEYMTRTHHGHYYAKAQNLSRKLRKSYDDALASADVLLMPTSPIAPPLLPPANATREQLAYPGFIPTLNAAAFDVTGHPALSVPCGVHDGLPVGMQLIARHFDEANLYRAAHAYERTVS